MRINETATMTDEQAIRWFKANFPDYIFATPTDKQMAYRRAIDALEDRVNRRAIEIPEHRIKNIGTIETPKKG